MRFRDVAEGRLQLSRALLGCGGRDVVGADQSEEGSGGCGWGGVGSAAGLGRWVVGEGVEARGDGGEGSRRERMMGGEGGGWEGPEFAPTCCLSRGRRGADTCGKASGMCKRALHHP